jgi:membrane protein DedA with SNARE-associated domain
MLHYVLVFLAAYAVDVIPFFGPPAWIVMVFLQVHYGLDIWIVLISGVVGSTLGRYTLSRYIPVLSSQVINRQKNADLEFLGTKLSENGWRVQLFVFLYTLVPLPSLPLFTVSGIAHIRMGHVIPAFFAGKFISDMIMVITGNYVSTNVNFSHQMYSWENVSGIIIGVCLIAMFLFIDWRKLIQHKKLSINFNIWKSNNKPV